VGNIQNGRFIGTIAAAADFMAPGAIEINRYQPEIMDLVRRRFYFGQRINQTPATGQPSRYFEQLAIPSATWTDPRQITPTPSQPQRVEKVVTLKAIVGQVNYSTFDVEVNQQQGQFAFLEAKDLSDTVDSVLKAHDIGLWAGTDTDLIVPATSQYFGVSGQIVSSVAVGSPPSNFSTAQSITATGSLIQGVKTQVAKMVSRKDFEVKPSGLYGNPMGLDLFDQEASTLQLYYNETEILPGVIVKAIPTQAGLLPLIPDAGLDVLPDTSPTYQYTFFILSEEFIEYHWLTSPVPRVFQLGLLANLAAQFVVLKFGAVVVKGASYAHSVLYTVR
jgi:hypothetical protein